MESQPPARWTGKAPFINGNKWPKRIPGKWTRKCCPTCRNNDIIEERTDHSRRSANVIHHRLHKARMRAMHRCHPRTRQSYLGVAVVVRHVCFSRSEFRVRLLSILL